MVQLTNIFVALLAASAVSAMPLQKRIAQTIADSTQQWVQACVRRYHFLHRDHPAH
jgi:hypothetical protein